ncbi:MAG: COX15/CtaA family protein, partial [Planctomycetaceae bacterium]
MHVDRVDDSERGSSGLSARGVSGWNWPHIAACLLVAITATLLGFGALVTTYDAAMAVPDWPATYGHNMFLFPMSEWLGGPWDLFLEHGHRLLGAVTGLATLALAVCMWSWPVGTTLRWLAVAAVGLVLVQGILGGARVLLDDTTIAKVHACTGPLFFAVAVAIAVLSRDVTLDRSASRIAVDASTILPVASYAQLVAGAQLRHLDPSVPPGTFHALVGTHIVLGFVVLALSIAAASIAWRQRSRVGLRWAGLVLGLVVCHFGLGLGTWVVKYGVPSALLPDAWRLSQPLVARSLASAITITGHAVLGMAILGVSIASAIATHRWRTCAVGFRPIQARILKKS